jgi:MscS family membrane protein
MDFLNEIFYSNSIKSYCIVAGIILLMLIVKRFLSRYIASLLYRLVKRIWKNIEKKSFVDLLIEPLEWFLVILISVFSIDKLNFPEEWKYSVYGHSVEEIVNKIGIGIIIISFTWLLLRMVDFIAVVLERKASLTKDKNDDQLIVFFRDFLKVLIVVCGLLLLIKACFNQPIGQLLIGLSFVGAAFAFAAKESLENLIASFIIFFDKPFTTGDTLKVNNVTGAVERIGLRSTRIRTDDKTLVTVPNKQMVDSIVDNWTLRTQRRAEINLELSSKTNASLAKQCIAAITQLLNSQDEFISPSVYFTDINKTGFTITVEYFTHYITMDEFNNIKQSVNLSLLKILEENGVELNINSIDFAARNTAAQ